MTFTGGLNYETMTEQRKGYENFVMSGTTPVYGREGNLRRDERNLMWNVDPYLQTGWQLTEKLSLEAGVRYSSVWFDSNDHYITAQNGDDSGEANYHKWLPGRVAEICRHRCGMCMSPPDVGLKHPPLMNSPTVPMARAG